MRPMKPRRPGSPHDALAQMMAEIGAAQQGDGVQIAADFEGKTKFTFYKLLDPDQDGELSFVRVARLTEHFAVTAAAEHLAGLCGCVLVRVPESVPAPRDLLAATGAALKETGDVIAAVTAALVDGEVSAADRARIRPEIRQAMALFAALELIVREDGQ